MTVTVAQRIQEAFSDLPRAERRVAHEVLSAYPVAGLETIARLAERSEVSGPTVIRFTSRLGFDGYPAFQGALLAELDQRHASPLLQFTGKVNPGGDIVDRSAEVLTGCLKRSLDHLDRRAFGEAVERLAASPGRLLTAGGRFSELSTLMLSRHLEILRPSVRHLPQDQWIAYSLDVRRTDTVVVADFRRYQRITIDFAREWKRRGAVLILLTDPWMSPLAIDADVVLTAAVDSPSPFDSQIACAGICEALIGGVVDHLGDSSRSRIADYDQLWERQAFSYTDNNFPASEGTPQDASK